MTNESWRPITHNTDRTVESTREDTQADEDRLGEVASDYRTWPTKVQGSQTPARPGPCTTHSKRCCNTFHFSLLMTMASISIARLFLSSRSKWLTSNGSQRTKYCVSLFLLLTHMNLQAYNSKSWLTLRVQILYCYCQLLHNWMWRFTLASSNELTMRNATATYYREPRRISCLLVDSGKMD